MRWRGRDDYDDEILMKMTTTRSGLVEVDDDDELMERR